MAVGPKVTIAQDGIVLQVVKEISLVDDLKSVDLKNVVPQGGLTCLFAKATLDESNLWHKRLGHVNFKTINKLVKGNLVRGIENPNSTWGGKLIRCDNRTEFKNRVMNQFCEMKGNQSNGSVSTKVCDDAGKARLETVPGKDYILLPLWTQIPPFSSSSKDSPNARFKPSGEEEKKDAKDPKWMIVKNIVYGCADDLNMPNLEDIVYSDDDEEVGAEADINNLDAVFFTRQF
ncbi:ribonuclease H-like domain-containing protein [Tanacetum coccineum]